MHIKYNDLKCNST